MKQKAIFSCTFSMLLMLLLLLIPFGIVKAKSTSSDSDFVIEDGVLIKYKGSASEVVIPEGVTVIGNGDKNGFVENHEITSIILPDSLKEIKAGAFYMCKNLTKIDIPESVTTIERSAFSSCESLLEIDIPKSVTTIGSKMTFFNTPWLEAREKESDMVIVNGILISGYPAEGEIIIPEGVTKIAADAMSFSSITKVYLPESLEEIGDGAFSACSFLEEVHMDDNVKKIGDSVFEDCSKLKELEIPVSVQEIGEDLFFGIKAAKRPTLVVCKDSFAHQYARENKLKYKAVADPEEGKSITVKVQKGDSLWKIAREHLGRGIRYEEIVKLNHLKGTMIFVGQELKVPMK